MLPLNNAMMAPAMELFDSEEAYRSGGWEGAWDKDMRLAQMDREGIAAEFVHHGFFRVNDLGFSVMNDTYPGRAGRRRLPGARPLGLRHLRW